MNSSEIKKGLRPASFGGGANPTAWGAKPPPQLPPVLASVKHSGRIPAIGWETIIKHVFVLCLYQLLDLLTYVLFIVILF